MKKMIGYTAIWMAVGMLVMLLIGNRFIGIIMIGALALSGYALFCN